MKTYDPLITIGHSLVLNQKSLHWEEFNELYVLGIRSILERLTEAGRTNERLTWVQGDYIPGEFFPLDITFGNEPQEFYRIIATCRILESKVNKDVVDLSN